MSAVPVGIVGLGLVGGSLALDLVDRDVPVLGLDTEPEHRDLAAAAGIEVLDDLATLARRADLVVLAVPPAAVAGVLAQVTAAAPEVVVTDVASVKSPATLGVTAPPARWVGGHPMAGTERTGFAAARPGMLAGATWLLTPTDVVDRDALVAVLRLVLSVQAVPVVLDAHEHDRVVAAVSHVSHLLAYALHDAAGQHGRELVDLVAGPSFRDATRVAASDPGFWADLTHRNLGAVREVMGEVQAWLTAATTEDAAALTRRLAGARRRPLAPSHRAPVAVELDDLPGALARLRQLGQDGHAVTSVATGSGGVRVEVARR